MFLTYWNQLILTSPEGESDCPLSLQMLLPDGFKFPFSLVLGLVYIDDELGEHWLAGYATAHKPGCDNILIQNALIWIISPILMDFLFSPVI